MCRIGTHLPGLVPLLNRLGAAAMGHRNVTDRSDRVFANAYLDQVQPSRVRDGRATSA